MRILTLIEDTKKDARLTSELGLSLLIETKEKKILMDTGSSGNFIKNSEYLGATLSDVNDIIISHAHADHCGGLETILQSNTSATVYMHKDTTKRYYGNIGAILPVFLNIFVHRFVEKSKLFSKYNGVNHDLFEQYKNRIKFVTETTEISKNIFLVSNIQNEYPLPKGNKFLLVENQGILQHENFSDELALVVKENDGLVLFSGCCHNGILNMVKTVRDIFPNYIIKAIVGGFHLRLQPEKNNMAGSKADIELLANELINQKIPIIYTGHCTGEKAYKILKNVLGDKISHLYTGCIINV